MNTGTFKDKIVVVTGGASGIGRALGQELCSSGARVVLADINAGLLYILAMTSMGVYGVIIAGWASNSKYALLGAMRSAAQIVACLQVFLVRGGIKCR